MSRRTLAFAPALPLRAAAPARPACTRRAPRASAAADPAASEKLFSRLAHVNKNLRVKAAADLARMPPSEVVPRLVALLDEEDTAHRRAAVQTLGMVGEPAVPALVAGLRESEDVTVRASCSKALAAVAMYFPRSREGFDAGALDAMEAVLDGGVVDPVTKIATVGCLTTLACDAALREDEGGVEGGEVAAAKSAVGADGVEVVHGNERAVDMLVRMLRAGDDIALSASVCGALAQIANCGTPERKATILGVLKDIADGEEDEDEDSGFGYVQEMCRSHVSQLDE